MTASAGALVVERREIGAADWDAFVAQAEEAWLWHRWALLDALATWPETTDVSLAYVHEGRVAGVLPLRRIASRRLRVVPFEVLESHGGPAVADGLGRRLRTQVREALVRHALEKAGRRTHELRLTLPPLAPAYGPERPALVNPLLALGAENTLGQTWIVDLRASVDELWDGLEGRTRTAIRKAQREEVEVRVATAADLDEYVRLHRVTCARTGIAPHPPEYFAAIWCTFVAGGGALVLFAEREGQTLAARNFGIAKGAATTWTAAGTVEAGRSGANALLQWEAMTRLKAAGVRWCESGEAFEGATEGKLRGLTDFKKSFGGALYPYYRGRFDLRPRVLRAVDAAR